MFVRPPLRFAITRRAPRAGARPAVAPDSGSVLGAPLDTVVPGPSERHHDRASRSLAAPSRAGAGEQPAARPALGRAQDRAAARGGVLHAGHVVAVGRGHAWRRDPGADPDP